jgi:excisionase family DNA binding protein
MTVEELRRYLRVSRTTAYAMVKRGDVPVVRIGRGRIRIPRVALVRELAKNMERPLDVREARLSGPQEPRADENVSEQPTAAA